MPETPGRHIVAIVLQFLNICAKRRLKPTSGNIILLAVYQLSKAKQELLQAVKYSRSPYSSI